MRFRIFHQRGLRSHLAIIFLLSTVALAACGGGDSTPQPVTGETGEASPAKTSDNAEIEPVEISMGIIPTYYTFGPHFVAEGLGLLEELEDRGITIEMVPFRSGADETKALVSGQLDMASSMFTEAAIAMAKGEDLKLALVFWNGGVSSMLVSTDYESTDLQSLREELGRPIKVGVTGFGSGTHVAALAQLKNLGLSDDDYEIVPVGGIQAYFPSLAEGQVDVVEAGEPATQKLIDDGFGRVIVNGWDAETVEKVFGEFQANGLHVRQEFLDEHPDAVQAVVEAFAEALTYMNDNADDPSKILEAYPDEALEVIGDVHEDVWPRIRSVISHDGCPTVEAAESVEKALKDAELLGESVEVDWSEHMTTEFLAGACA